MLQQSQQTKMLQQKTSYWKFGFLKFTENFSKVNFFYLIFVCLLMALQRHWLYLYTLGILSSSFWIRKYLHLLNSLDLKKTNQQLNVILECYAI